MNDSDINSGVSCTPRPPSNMPIAGKRIVVMQGRHGRDAMPVSVHDSLDNAMVAIGKRAAECLLQWGDTQTNALYLMTVDR